MNARYDQLVILLSSGLGQRKMYFRDHPKVAALCERFAAQLDGVLREAGKESFLLGVVDGKLVHDGNYLIGSTIAGGKVVALAEQLRCGGFLFHHGAEPRELSELYSLSAELAEPASDLEEARRLLRARGVRLIELAVVCAEADSICPSAASGAASREDEDSARHLEAVIQLYQSLFHTVEAVHGQAAAGDQLDVEAVRSLSEKLSRVEDGGCLDLMRLVRYPDHDSYLIGHSVRVATIAVLVGHRWGLPPPQLHHLGEAGLLHDVGKACIPEEILYKPDGLNAEQRRAIEEHAALGARLLLQNRAAGMPAVAAALGHHWRHDGGGYPARPTWAAPGRLTALLHICDVYEALTAVRPYKRALAPRRAYEIMLADEGAFAPDLLAAFVRALGLYPPGSSVRMSTGEQALVIAAGADIERPLVRVTHHADGRALRGADAPTLDLGCDASGGMEVAALLAE